nr:hypothetical protein [Clostridia bacterium]
MDENKKVMMVMPHMMGGGAERVAAQIINSMNRTGCETRFLLIRAKRDEVVNTDLDDKTGLILLSEKLKAESLLQKLAYLPLRLYSTFVGTLYEKKERDVPASAGWASVVWQYHREIRWIRDYLLQYPDLAVMVFLQPAIPIVMLAAEGLPNRVVFSERADPERLMKKRYGRRFIEKYYARADAAVFQTEAARAGYPDNIAAKGTVIPNPLKPGLPDRYTGERSKRIVTFCRISKQKNLPLAIRAFALFSESHPEYTFAVYGDALYEEGLGVERECKKLISELNLAD